MGQGPYINDQTKYIDFKLCFDSELKAYSCGFPPGIPGIPGFWGKSVK